jgi:phenylalanyl-tRNA synthetase alpha chain
MKEQLEKILSEALESIEQANDVKSLNDCRVLYLGKKSAIQSLMPLMGKMEQNERAAFGQLINSVKGKITTAIETKAVELEKIALKKRLEDEAIDVTLPGVNYNAKSFHPMQVIVDEITDICLGMGYEIEEGPEVESDHYNFELLNLPKEHPARDMQDTFYIDENTLLRTHTSPVQARTLLKHQGKGPVKIICPGKVYRRDDDDATHSHQFFQIEGLVVDKNVTMADLKGTLDLLAKRMFGDKRTIRLRSSFFPFTEPSVEVDVSCYVCDGKGCNVCKGSGWIEILGAGMVHPNVLRMSGFDPKEYQGFAFGIGVERIAILRYGIDDIRHFYTNDLRFLNQFSKER